MKVRQVLTSHVAVATRQEPLLDAIRRMREEHVGALIVVATDGDAAGQGVRRPIGMLTDRDIVVGVFAKDGAHVATLEVGDVMTEDLVTATADEDVGEVLLSVKRITDPDNVFRDLYSKTCRAPRGLPDAWTPLSCDPNLGSSTSPSVERSASGSQGLHARR